MGYKLGEKIGEWTVVAFAPEKSSPKTKVYLAECGCGFLGYIYSSNDKKGFMCRKCSAKARSTHGMANSNLYHIWANMIQRCINPRASGYNYYGAKGVRVCERWMLFTNFYEDMRDRPGPEYSIERLDPDGNYEPENCTWADRIEQANNKRRCFKEFRRARLKEEQVREIKKLRATGCTYAQIGEQFNVSPICVCSIILGKFYKWVKDENSQN